MTPTRVSVSVSTGIVTIHTLDPVAMALLTFQGSNEALAWTSLPDASSPSSASSSSSSSDGNVPPRFCNVYRSGASELSHRGADCLFVSDGCRLVEQAIAPHSGARSLYIDIDIDIDIGEYNAVNGRV